MQRKRLFTDLQLLTMTVLACVATAAMIGFAVGAYAGSRSGARLAREAGRAQAICAAVLDDAGAGVDLAAETAARMLRWNRRVDSVAAARAAPYVADPRPTASSQ